MKTWVSWFYEGLGPHAVGARWLAWRLAEALSDQLCGHLPDTDAGCYHYQPTVLVPWTHVAVEAFGPMLMIYGGLLKLCMRVFTVHRQVRLLF